MSQAVRQRFLTSILPGIGVAALAAVAARAIGALTPIPAVFFALLIGMAAGSLFDRGRLEAGIDFALKRILRFGVALLGMAITFGEIATLGWSAAFLTIAALGLTLALGFLVARKLGDSPGGSILSATAVAICGASAALAVAAALPKGTVDEKEVARTVAGITIAGTVGLLLFPYLALALDLSPTQTGVFLGGSLHEVAQAAAAGFAVSDEVGKVATVTKMLRVACMGVVIALMGWLAGRGKVGSGEKLTLFPGFLIAFVVLATISSLGLVPEAVKILAVDVSRWCLLVAIAALGMRTSSATLIKAGARPLLAIALNSLLIAALMLGGVMAFRI